MVDTESDDLVRQKLQEEQMLADLSQKQSAESAAQLRLGESARRSVQQLADIPLPSSETAALLEQQSNQMGDYMAYQKAQHGLDEVQRTSDLKKERHFQIALSVLSAVLGGLVTLLVEHAQEIVSFLWELLSK